MKLGKIYKCEKDNSYIQKTADLTMRFNIVSLSEGVTIGKVKSLSYYDDALSKVTKQERKWFLKCIIENKLLPLKKSKKDKLIDELIEQNNMLVEALEDLCPGFTSLCLTEVTKEI